MPALHIQFRTLSLALVFVPLFLSVSVVHAQQDVANTVTNAAATRVTTSIFKEAQRWRGKLGEDVVEMRLQPKLEDIDSVEGDYIVFGGNRNKGNKILLAGEVNGTTLTMEESEDGVDVSGQWDGKLEGKILRGKWQSDDGKTIKDFILELMPPAVSKAGKSKRASPLHLKTAQ
ncbi:hypothetical protein AAKU64_001779 [Undibacterium sp. GrIS 1.8]|uniref:hypothetical protein n=1 Tax=unclassified Undibacterium TaxID=2630295 RepID=UPI003396D5A6